MHLSPLSELTHSTAYLIRLNFFPYFKNKSFLVVVHFDAHIVLILDVLNDFTKGKLECNFVLEGTLNYITPLNINRLHIETIISMKD
jgi:hypothetical protein